LDFLDSFEGVHDVPYEPAPAPAPGPALLDDTESHMLENFFNTMGSNQLENNDLFFGDPHQTGPTGDLNFDWGDELPPIFAGSRTTLPQPSTLPQTVPLGDDGLLGLEQNHGDDAATTSPEILAAASMLYQNQNGQINGGDMGHMYHNQPFYGGHHPTNTQHPSLGLSNGMPPQRPSMPRKPSYAVENGNLMPNSYYGAPQPSAQDQGLSKQLGGLRWGSDVSFIDQGYMAPPTQETEEEVTNNLLQSMECLEPQSSANNTRPASPTAVRQEPPNMTKGHSNRMSGKSQSSSLDHSVLAEADLRPRKKVKTKVKDEDDGSDEFEAASAKTKKSKSNSKNRRLSSTTESPSKRRKSQASNSKLSRENLSEEQKRSNHILSEQKRRNLIKQGFDDLCDLVPELQGGGFSKSAMLIQAADYLEEILRGNDDLKAQLADLRAGEGLGGYG
jgi:hypothetical protein